MLVLSRKPGEAIQIGVGITVTVLASRRGQVKLGIDAPKEFSIHRSSTNVNDGNQDCRRSGNRG